MFKFPDYFISIKFPLESMLCFFKIPIAFFLLLWYHSTMRIDKFLKVSRILKRRTIANEACDNNRVLVNGKEVKPSFQLKINDIVEIKFSSNPLIFKVLKLTEHAKKEDAESMYEIVN